MKFSQTPKQIASMYFTRAIGDAIRGLEQSIKECGELCGPSSKLSPEVKEYFSDQVQVYAETIAELLKMKDQNNV